jgi:4-amino-4-deoxy-L-arabinose transferase-like glycosyltransferase
VVVRKIPVHDAVRAPMVPFLMAALFWLFGVHLALPVLMNIVTVLAIALLLFVVARRLAGDAAGLIAVLVYFVSDRYELVWALNNNLLVLGTLLLLLLGLLAERPQLSRGWLIAALAVVSALGFYVKPTFPLTAVPASLWIIARPDWEARGLSLRRSTLVAMAVYLGGSFLLVAPWLLENYLVFGKPLFSQVPLVRIALRHEFLAYGAGATERFGRPVTYADLAAQLGWLGVARAEAHMVLRGVQRIVMDNLGLLLVAALIWRWAGLRWPRGRWLLLGLLSIEPIFAALIYMVPSRRYLWPLYILIMLVFSVALAQAGGPRMARLGRRWKRIVLQTLVVLTALNALYLLSYSWRTFVDAALHTPTPAWAAPLAATPEQSRVLSSDPNGVAWYTQRLCINTPLEDRQGLLRTLTVYKPNYYLWLADRHHGARARFLPGELAPVAGGQDWQLYRIQREAPGLREAYAAPTPPGV